MATHRGSGGRVFWGIIIILFGVLLLLDQLGRLDFGSIISRYWPVLLILIGLWQLFANSFRSPAGPLFIIALGVIFELGRLQILGRSAWHYVWPLLIIAVGLGMLLGALGRRTPTPGAAVTESSLDAFVIFSGMNRRIESPSFRGGKATAIMGGIELDLRGAKLAAGSAALDLSVILGGISLRIPRAWRVEVNAHPLLGGVEDKHTFEPGAEGAGTLHIKASAILGGIEIKD
jgi:hypothetical protein